MKRFFEIDSKREFFAIAKYIRTHGKGFINEVLGRWVECRAYRSGDMYLFVWYGDSTYMYSLDLSDGKFYYYFPQSGKVVVKDADYKVVDVIVA